VQIHCYLCNLSLPLERLLEAFRLEEGKELVNAKVTLFDSFFSGEVHSTSDWHSLQLDHLGSEGLENVERRLQASYDVSFILAVHECDGMGQDLRDVLVVQHVDPLVICERIVQYIHYDRRIRHHIQRIYCRSDVSLVPPVEDDFDALHAPADDS
jgi:hypothetical protein